MEQQTGPYESHAEAMGALHNINNSSKPLVGQGPPGPQGKGNSTLGGSILDRLASSKENGQPSSKENSQPDAHVKSEFVKDRQPARGILRRADDGAWSKLQDKFSSLEGEMMNFSSQTQARRDSLTRTSVPAPQLQQSSCQQQVHTVGLMSTAAPSASACLRSAAEPPWLAAPRVPLAAAPAPQQHKQQHDGCGGQDDDGCTGVLGGHGSGAKELLITIPAGAAATTKTAKAAVDTFEEAGLLKLVGEGLHKQLQRTKDGATDKSRINELAELVKLLRKCVKELGSRATLYIDQCVKIERECAQQLETSMLSSKTSLKQLEAELASTRQSLAECERDFRNDKAKWGMDLDTQRSETSRLVRELERLTEERDRARDDAKRAEQQRQQLDAELKELRKAASQQMREVSANQSEAVRLLTEDKIAAGNTITSLRDEATKMSKTLKAQQDCVTEYEREVQLLRATVDNLRGSLAGKESAAGVQSEQITKLHKELAHTREQLTALIAEEQRLQQEVTQGSEERAEMGASLERQAAELEGQRQRLVTLEKRAEEDTAAWGAARQEMEESLAAITTERTSLSETISYMKAALGRAMKQNEEAETDAAREASEKAALLRERTNLQHQLEFAESGQSQAEQATAAVRTQLEGAQAELATSRQQVEDKEARLAHLEGEFEALKEVLGETAAATGDGASGGKDIVTTLLSKIATLQNAAAAAEAVRRKLHNELVDIRGNIRVYCRVRPHPSPSTRLGPDGASIALSADGKEHAFGYDRVFGPDSSQESVFGGVSELVQSALDGFHVCIFSYGQTGAGKTHTMQGGESVTSRGIIPRAVDKILATARKLEEQAEWTYSMEASFIEIYNNQLRDLLGGGAGGAAAGAGAYINDLHAIKHDPDGGHTIVAGVSKVPVTDSEGAAVLVRRAAAARAVEATAMNSVSSRSHSVFMLYITGWHAGSGTRLQGCLCLVDLAGSERLDRSLAEGQAKKEACAINQSLSALGDVFASLSSKSSHVPYRNAKLTYLLQPCLGGSGKTLMFVNINPEPASAGESLCSLRFASKVSGCETGAKGGARRNVLTLGGGGAGGSETGTSAGGDPAGEARRRGAAPAGASAAAVAPGAATGTVAASASAGPSFHLGRMDPPPPRPPGARSSATTSRAVARGTPMAARGKKAAGRGVPASVRATSLTGRRPDPPGTGDGPATGRRLPKPSTASIAVVAEAEAAAELVAPATAPPASMRCSLSGLPRPPTGGTMAADKRMSMLPQRGAGSDAGAVRMSLAGMPRGAAGTGSAAGQKRPAPGAGPAGNAPKRSRP